MQKPYISYDKALQKMQRYCAYQDRCHKEVRQKLMELGVYRDWQDQIIVALIEDKFLDELRFACSFAGGKFRIKSWGRNRIVRELKSRAISDYCIKKALETEIPEQDYLETLHQLLLKRIDTLKHKNKFERNRKLAEYALYRGFESHLIWESIHSLFPD